MTTCDLHVSMGIHQEKTNLLKKPALNVHRLCQLELE